jgi:hypoxanthine phosphoribosyltransferase
MKNKPQIDVLISEADIAKRVKEMGEMISKDYAGKEVTLVTLLRGSVIFAADLARALDLDVVMDFMTVKSYEGTESTGEVRILQDLEEGVAGKNVLIVEDIVDTGQTLSKVFKLLKSRNPESLEICSFLDKPSRRKKEVHVKYVGYEIPDKFVIGYGLDFDQKYRQLPYIGVVTS